MASDEQTILQFDFNMDDPATWQKILALANSQYDQFEATGDVSYLDIAIANTKVAFQRFRAAGLANSSIAAQMANLGSMLMARYEIFGKRDDLEAAVQETRAGLQLCSEGNPSYAQICYMLSMLLSNLYEQEKDICTLEESVNLAEEAVDKGDKENKELYAEFLSNLSSRLLATFDAKGTDIFLKRAVDMSERAIDIIETPVSGLPRWINALGLALQTRFEVTGVRDDIMRAIDCSEMAIKYGGENDPGVYGYQSNLSSQLVRLYETTGNDEALSRATESLNKACSLLPEGHIGRGPLHLNLATTQRSLFHHTGDATHLDKAIETMEKAVELIPEQHSEHLRALHGLANLLLGKFERTGEEVYLQDAISRNYKAVVLSSETARLRPKILLDAALLQYYDHEWDGEANKLDAALEYISEALIHTEEGDLDFAMMLSTQSKFLIRRSERTARLEDLTEASELGRKALSLTPQGSPNMLQRMTSMGVAMIKTFERTGNIKLLGDAAEIFGHAAELTQVDPHQLLSLHVNQSTLFMLLFKATQDPDYLDHAMRAVESIKPSILIGHPYQAKMMNNTALLMKEKVACGKSSPEEVEKIVQFARDALALIKEDHPDRVVILKTLGDCIGLTKTLERQKQAMESYKDAWDCKNGLPIIRLDAAQAYLETFIGILDPLSDQSTNYQFAATISQDAVSLLTSITNASISRQDQQQILSKGAGLTALACSLALQMDKSIDEAMDILERGRALIISSLLDRKKDLADLNATDEGLAARFQKLRDYSSIQFEGLDGASDFRLRQSMQNKRLNAFFELQGLIEQIRKRPDMSRFLFGPDAAERRKLAANRVFVAVNITKLRSDAIITTSGGTNLVHLQGLQHDTALSWVRKDLIKHDSLQEFGRKNKLCHEFLKWLWTSCVGPIIKSIHDIISKSDSSSECFEIYWIGSGLGSRLPFHAAGDHFSRTDYALSHTISSYVPTFKAYAETLQKAGQNQKNQRGDRLLFISMPTTPGEPDLGKVKEEETEIQECLRGILDMKSLEYPSAKHVLSQINDYSMVHFACHGVTDSRDPSQSHLKLQKSTIEADPLTVQEISESNLLHVKLAFLSACSTADNPTLSLADEVLHLASGFQVSGFENVIATMWPTEDSFSVHFAKEFYKALFDSGGLQNGGTVARAVTDATQALRKRKVKQPLLWAQYVHWGVG